MKINLIKTLLASLLVLPSLLAQEYVSDTLATDTPVELITTPATLRSLTCTASTAAITVFKFYDNNDPAADHTNVVYAATTTPLQYATNWSVAYTNADGVLLTNTFTGLFKGTTVVAAVTNERPRAITITVPASSQRIVTLTKRLAYGLVVQSSAAGLVEVEYDSMY